MTTTEQAREIANRVGDWLADTDTVAPFLESEAEELARVIEPLIAPPARPAAVTITDQMVERAAEALYLDAHDYPDATPFSEIGPRQNGWRRMATKALDADFGEKRRRFRCPECATVFVWPRVPMMDDDIRCPSCAYGDEARYFDDIRDEATALVPVEGDGNE